jgi:hypothetical protein
MVAFVVLGEGGVAGGVVPRGKDDGGTIDGEGGAAMASLYQYTVVRTSRTYIKAVFVDIPAGLLGDLP